MNFLGGFTCNRTSQWRQKDFWTIFWLNYKQEQSTFLKQVKLCAAEKEQKQKIFTNNFSYAHCVCSLFPALVSTNSVTAMSTVPSTPRQFLFPALSSLGLLEVTYLQLSHFWDSLSLLLLLLQVLGCVFLRNLSCHQRSHSLCKPESCHFCFKGTCHTQTKNKHRKTCHVHKGIISHRAFFGERSMYLPVLCLYYTLILLHNFDLIPLGQSRETLVKIWLKEVKGNLI